MQIYPYQQECLDAIESAKQSGANKALVVMATGLGKTVVSAIELKRLLTEAPGRVLYLTHQKDILRQARAMYKEMLNNDLTYGYFHGQEKHLHRVDVLFASFQTMATSRELFQPDEFKYIVVDEVHHVQAETYRPTVQYFKPDFMMGLTATPERGDRKDITELMGEPVFQLGLFEALAEGYLTKVDYRLMTDELQNLEVLDTPAGKLSIAELNRTIFVPKRDEEIVRIIEEKTDQVKKSRTIIFCASIAHAEQLAELMPYAQLVHSKIRRDQRERRLDAFRKGRSDTVITIDMFNEGIDIPEANVIVFLRSTASRTIFLQQLGRGLRSIAGKTSVLVLDFVANCERIEMIDYLQTGVEAVAAAIEEQSIGDGEAQAESKLSEMFKLTIGGAEFDERLVNLRDLIFAVRQQASYSEDELIGQLQRMAEELGRTPNIADLEGFPWTAHYDTFRKKFGSWNNAVRAAKLIEQQWQRRPAEVLIQQLQEFAEELGRTPTASEVQARRGIASAVTYARIFGSYSKAVVAAGLKPARRRDYTDAELIAQIQRLAREVKGVPTERDVDGASWMASKGVFRKRFGLWSQTLAAAGIRAKRTAADMSDDEMLELIGCFVKIHGRAPTTTEVDSTPWMPMSRTYIRRFGSWSYVVEAAGFTPRKPSQTTSLERR